MLHVLFQATEEVRRQDFVQRLHLPRRLHGAEFRLELLLPREAPPVHEVEERPELRGVVLQRRARQEHDAPREVERAQVSRGAPAAVLQAVRLVHDQTAPGHLRQRRSIRLRHLVRGQHHVCLVHRLRRDGDRVLRVRGVLPRRAFLLGGVFRAVRQLVLSQERPRRRVADIGHDVRVGGPPGRLSLPIHQRRERHDHERGAAGRDRRHGGRVGTPRAAGPARPEDVIHERERLRRLSEPHLVRQDAASFGGDEIVRHPTHALALVPAQDVRLAPVPIARLGNGALVEVSEVSARRRSFLRERGARGELRGDARENRLVARQRGARVLANPRERLPGRLFAPEPAAPAHERGGVRLVVAVAHGEHLDDLETRARHGDDLARGAGVFLPELGEALRREGELGRERAHRDPRAVHERAAFELDEDFDRVVVVAAAAARGGRRVALAVADRGRGRGRGRRGATPTHELFREVQIFRRGAQDVRLHRGPLVDGPRRVRRRAVREDERGVALREPGRLATLVLVLHRHVLQDVVPEGRPGRVRHRLVRVVPRLLGVVARAEPAGVASESGAFELDEIHRRRLHVTRVRRQDLGDRRGIEAFKRALQRLLLRVVRAPSRRGATGHPRDANHGARVSRQ